MAPLATCKKCNNSFKLTDLVTVDDHFVCKPCQESTTQRGLSSGAVPCSKDFEQLYYDLLYCVGNKYPGETRHKTAKRYLVERERQTSEPAKSL